MTDRDEPKSWHARTFKPIETITDPPYAYALPLPSGVSGMRKIEGYGGKLDALMLCRFEKLGGEEYFVQRITRRDGTGETRYRRGPWIAGHRVDRAIIDDHLETA